MLVSEIIGPAGAGKTTLLEALERHGREVSTIHEFRKPSHLPAYLRAAGSTLSDVIRRPAEALNELSAANIHRVNRVKAATEILGRLKRRERGFVVVDQGPVYTLARVSTDISDAARRTGRSPDARRRWFDLESDLAKVVDLLILLDADDDTLVRRIQTRSKAHSVKHETEENARAYVQRQRAYCQRAVDRLGSIHRVQVIRCEEPGLTTDARVRRILSVFESLTATASAAAAARSAGGQPLGDAPCN